MASLRSFPRQPKGPDRSATSFSTRTAADPHRKPITHPSTTGISHMGTRRCTSLPPLRHLPWQLSYCKDTPQQSRDACFHPVLLNVVSKPLRKGLRLAPDIFGPACRNAERQRRAFTAVYKQQYQTRGGNPKQRANLISGFCRDRALFPLLLNNHNERNALQMQFYT